MRIEIGCKGMCSSQGMAVLVGSDRSLLLQHAQATLGAFSLRSKGLAS